MNREPNDMELDTLLAQARAPELPEGFSARFEKRLEKERTAQIIQFRPRTAAPVAQQPSLSKWWLGAPLAASLLIGLSLGYSGYGQSVLGTADDVAFVEESYSTVFEEAETAAAEDSAS
jgi:hypothetical protein